MRGTILVLDTPFFTRTGTNGVFRLERLPVGRYTLKAWLDEKTEWKRSVELREVLPGALSSDSATGDAPRVQARPIIRRRGYPLFGVRLTAAARRSPDPCSGLTMRWN